MKKLGMKTSKADTSSPDSKYIKVIKKNLVTPLLQVHFCSLVKPFYYAGSHVPRYKVAVTIDPSIKIQKKYLEKLEKLAEAQKVDTLGREGDYGLIHMNYQSKICPKIYLVEEAGAKPEQVELEHDLPKGFQCTIQFDLKRYFDKFNKKNGFTFCPNKITFYPDEEMKKRVLLHGGDDQDRGI